MSSHQIAIAFIAIMGVFTGASAFAADWVLFSRHDECAPIGTLKRKLPDMPDIEDPEKFAAYLEAQGLQFTRQTHTMPKGSAVEFQVPTVELAVMFVQAGYCQNSALHRTD